ncbi:putative HTH-type transcriptional regulator [Aliiroseovarius pelagivivens]|uniref:Putative HTH-type transcriptional regulator n=1 Tax=Aliiroseovarius pelagivivens TaxID=1639690 RepID=A0A2R8AJC0_9RHOB|nr:helix-turn-helix domain-containing protein [Aliiroseovarius pelagivivens]SPF75999.1 putative HTH-type transcriptional regulator [Aliiroseovarius pelagivivens]
MEYGQFCPIAKASEIIGEKWTLLIIRELLMGSRRFSELQRGLGAISPTLLTRRLVHLEDRGMIMKRRISGQKGFEYLPTESCRLLLPILLSLGDWGMQWARSNLTSKDYDVGLLITNLQRSIQPDKLPSGEVVIHFKFIDVQEGSTWWLVVQSGEIDICDKDPGKDVDVYFTTTVKVMVDAWMGDTTYRKAIADGDMTIIGPRLLTDNVSGWMKPSVFSGSDSDSGI